MSRRCLICSNINPCRHHGDNEQEAELRRNQREIREMRSAAPPPDVAKLREAAQALIDEGPTLFRTATWHKLAEALASQDAPAVAGGMVERYRAAGRREGREAAAVEPGESDVERREALMEFAWSYEHEGETCFAVDIEDAIAALARPDRDAIVAETVAAIVAWLRQDPPPGSLMIGQSNRLADALESDDWRNSAALQVKP